MAAVLEQEKSYLFEEVEQHRLALTEKYDAQVKTLRQELAQLRTQLDAEKQAVAVAIQEGELARQKDTQDAEARSEEVVHSLRREMEIIEKGKSETSAHPEITLKSNKDHAELVSELASMKESFEAEKRELETQKTLLEEELAELQGLLEAEKKTTVEMSALKEALKNLKAEKREVENMAEGMKEKLYQAYQQKGAEQSGLEEKLQAARDEGHAQGEQRGFHQGKMEGLAQGKQEGFAGGFAEGRQRGIEEGQLQVNEEALTKEKQMEEQLDALRGERASLEKRLRQEKENSTRLNQMAQGRDQLKHSFDQILAEKDLLTARFDEAITTLTEQHEEEKTMLKSEIAQLEDQRLNLVAERTAAQAQLEALKKEISRQTMTKLEVEDSPRLEEQAFVIPQNRNAIQEEMEQLKLKLREAEVAQKGLELLKEEREGLIKENGDLEEALKKLRVKSHTEEGSKIKAQMAEINSLNEEKQKMKELLDQSSDQLMKASTSMALAQSNFVRQLEEMKRQQPKSSADVESYTRLQVSLLEHQRLVIVLQDTIREREALVSTVVQEGEDALQHVTQVSEAKLKDTQERLDWTHDLLVKQTEKYNQQVSLNQRNAVLLKDLYVENSELIKNLADNVAHSKKLQKKCASYRKSFRKLRSTVEDSAWVSPILERI
ncbi:ninein-like protein [Elysia marginata]|uniref:Ninein-like protein n=1 Tax=Elysia marginata TaxID=1093978 RepID=A0AAV4G5B1_9GAST|nr:ninein-like protein [Elysia marginata]